MEKTKYFGKGLIGCLILALAGNMLWFSARNTMADTAEVDDAAEQRMVVGSSEDDSGLTAVYRLYNSETGEHLYSLSTHEREVLVTQYNWTDEGTAWYVPSGSGTPVYRLYNPKTGLHHYTTDVNEYRSLPACGWNQEGISFYSDDSKTCPVYREYNPQSGNHNFTTSLEEHTALTTEYNWNDENTAFYAASEGDPNDTMKIPLVEQAESASVDTSEFVRTDADGITAKDILWMTTVVSREIRGGSRDAKVGVAAVILNRVESKVYDFRNLNTVEDVLGPNGGFIAYGVPAVTEEEIYQVLTDSRYNYDECHEAVIAALKGEDPTDGALGFWTITYWNSKGGCSWATWSKPFADDNTIFFGW
jgi:spore germination cell wall hydrolase CwlJ-like protein